MRSIIPNKAGLYIHVPFCKSICPYCDFAVLPNIDRLQDQWLNLVLNELRCRLPMTLIVDTLYIGGGTPSVLRFEILRDLFKSLRDEFKITVSELDEITLECNPESVTPDFIECCQALGVTRLSMGVQTLHSQQLKIMQRNHTQSVALQAIELIAKSGLHCSVDLMFGLPGQSVSDFVSDLKIISEFPLDHLSFYGLTFEKETLWGQKHSKGELKDSEDYDAFYESGVELVKNQGFERYEVSNFARHGGRSIHNQKYWDLEDWIGIGPGAYSFLSPNRVGNPRTWTAWKNWVESGALSATTFNEIIQGEKLRTEKLWLALRTKKGLNVKNFCHEFQVVFSESLVDKWVNEKMIRIQGGDMTICGKGWLFLDKIVAEFLDQW